MSKYVCPTCGGDTIHEFETGNTTCREIMFIRGDGKTRQVRTMNYRSAETGSRWWACAKCRNKIPVQTENELFR